MSFNAPPGVFDLVPEHRDAWKSSYLWNSLEKIIRELARDYGFKEIRTPIFEKTELFSRGIGETSDIVSKEMYTFLDRGERSLTLRPEGTAPVIRAFLENGLPQKGAYHKLFYISPMFRYERAQAGRYRQHHQFGVESFGNSSPESDAEIIDMAFTLLERIGMKNLQVTLNSLGNPESREKYREALKGYLRSQFEHLSKDSQTRFEKNPLRILDSKDEGDKKIVATAPSILDFLDQECKEHFEKVQKTLTLLNIPYTISPLLVRGLDYYQKTVFEITSSNLGAQNSMAGGGRYDGLIKELGGPDIPSVGFGMGLERVLQALTAGDAQIAFKPDRTTLFFVPLGDLAREECLKLQKTLRDAHIATETDLTGRKLNKVMAFANEQGAKHVAIVGDNELKERVLSLKEMTTGVESKVPFEKLVETLQNR